MGGFSFSSAVFDRAVSMGWKSAETSAWGPPLLLCALSLPASVSPARPPPGFVPRPLNLCRQPPVGSLSGQVISDVERRQEPGTFRAAEVCGRGDE